MLMSPELFLDCILYIINDHSQKARDLVRDLIALYESDNRMTATVDHDTTRFYIRIIRAIMDGNVSKETPDELRIILLKFQSDAFLSKRQEIYKLLYDTFMSKEQMSEEKREAYAERINNVFLWHRCNKVSRTIFGTLSRAGDMINPQDQASEIRKLRDITREVETLFTENGHDTLSSNGSLVERIDFSDKNSMKTALQKNQDRTVRGILRLGLVGLNRMLGKRGGLVRGESAMFYALPHNYKSGMIMSISGWVALYNTPTQLTGNGDKKALVLLISLENEAYQNAVWMFRHFYETQMMMSSAHLTDEEVADWTYTAFSAKGFTLIIERHKPNVFNYPAFVKCVEAHEASGYEIALAAIDYPNLMAKDGITHEAAQRHDLAVRALISALCNYTKSKGITFVGAHPLHRKAKELVSSGITNVVKRLDSSHLADSFDVAREVDFEAFIHIERNLDGTAYLTMQRGKHRYVDDTPQTHQYCAYRFHPQFGIRDDLLLTPEFVTDIYDDPLSKAGATGIPNQPEEYDFQTMSVF